MICGRQNCVRARQSAFQHGSVGGVSSRVVAINLLDFRQGVLETKSLLAPLNYLAAQYWPYIVAPRRAAFETAQHTCERKPTSDAHTEIVMAA